MSEASNVTGGVEKVEKPIPDRVLRRRKLKNKDDLKKAINELAERLSVPNLSKGKSRQRRTLPQINDTTAFLADLKKSKINTTQIKVDPEDLKPSQLHFNEKKVNAIVDGKSWNRKPIVISSDMFIVDGHHRWLAAAQANDSNVAIKVDMTFDEIDAFLKEKPYVDFKKLMERLSAIIGDNEMESLLESSLSRLWRKTQDHESAMLSAFRGGLSKAENRERSAKMAAALRKLGFSVTQIQGAYIESDSKGKPREVRELSFFVSNQNDDSKFENLIVKLGIKFDQDSVAIIPKGGRGAYLIGTNHTGFLGFKKKEVIGNSTWGGVSGEYFSKIGGRNFEFKSAKEALKEDRIESGNATGFLVESRYAKEIIESLKHID